MTSEGIGRIFRRKDGAVLIYLPRQLSNDSRFPFQNLEEGPTTIGGASAEVFIYFPEKGRRLIVEPAKVEEEGGDAS